MGKGALTVTYCFTLDKNTDSAGPGRTYRLLPAVEPVGHLSHSDLDCCRSCMTPCLCQDVTATSVMLVSVANDLHPPPSGPYLLFLADQRRGQLWHRGPVVPYVDQHTLQAHDHAEDAI